MLYDAAPAPIIKHNGGYLITGGCGVLGLKFAYHLAEEYQAKLLLIGRKPLSSGIQKHLEGLAQAGAKEVCYHTVDISDEAALISLSEKLPLID